MIPGVAPPSGFLFRPAHPARPPLGGFIGVSLHERDSIGPVCASTEAKCAQGDWCCKFHRVHERASKLTVGQVTLETPAPFSTVPFSAAHPEQQDQVAQESAPPVISSAAPSAAQRGRPAAGEIRRLPSVLIRQAARHSPQRPPRPSHRRPLSRKTPRQKQQQDHPPSPPRPALPRHQPPPLPRPLQPQHQHHPAPPPATPASPSPRKSPWACWSPSSSSSWSSACGSASSAGRRGGEGRLTTTTLTAAAVVVVAAHQTVGDPRHRRPHIRRRKLLSLRRRRGIRFRGQGRRGRDMKWRRCGGLGPGGGRGWRFRPRGGRGRRWGVGGVCRLPKRIGRGCRGWMFEGRMG